jgi:predicted DNA-binding transcriptional regulator
LKHSTAQEKPALRGNTLRVYTHIFKTKQTGIREVQRSLGLSSVSLAQYHLDKLVTLGLAKKDEVTGEYTLVKEIKVEALEHFLLIGSYMFPRFLLYTVIVSIVFGYFVFMTRLNFGGSNIWTFIIGVISLTAMWYETTRAWKKGP